MLKLIASATFLLLIFGAAVQAQPRVVAFAGSTREGSYNQLLVRTAACMAQEMGAEVTVVDLKDYPLPLYHHDLEAREGMPETGEQLRRLLIESDLILIASPQYNASIPALLKNTIDWMSRNPEGRSSREAFEGKTVVLLSASPGKKGGAKGLTHLKDIIEDVRGIVYPEFFSLPFAHQAFDENGQLNNQENTVRLRQVITGALQKP